MPVNSPERRIVISEIEVRAVSGKTFIEGHAAVFDKLSQNLGGFVERVRPGAFTKTLKESDVRALKNHDPNLLLGRSSSGTLELSQDDIGLFYRITPPDTSYSRDLVELMRRGDIRESSFGFFPVEEDWSLTEQGFPVREIIEARLIDVSVVTFPAYSDADALLNKRSALSALETRSGVTVDEMLTDDEKIKCAVGICTTERNASGETHEERSEKQIAAEKRLAELNAMLQEK